MGRKKKKNCKGGQKAKGEQPLEQQAAEHLAAGRFRQAVDAYKELFKTDPETYRSTLQAAYEGLYRQRLDKGMVQEAAMVLDQLEKLTGNLPGAAHIRLLLKRQAFVKAAESAVNVLGAGDALPVTDAALAADALVTAFEEMPRPNRLPDPIAADLDRIQAALKAVSETNYGQALESIKPIGLRSAFIAWKWLVKGLCAFHGHEDDKALAAFEKIAADTVPGAYAAPYARLLVKRDGQDGGAEAPATLEAVCTVAGFDAIAPVIARADYLWRVQRFRDSHTHLINQLESFPSVAVGLARSLTEFYYNVCTDMPFQQGHKYLNHLARCTLSRNGGDPVEIFWAQRTAALCMERYSSQDALVLEHWEAYLSAYAELYGDQPKARAMVYQRLGDLFAQEAQDNSSFSLFFTSRRRKRSNIRNPELARRCYELSLKALPDTKDTQLSLIAFYEKCGEAAKVNKLLDSLIKQFPEEKDVLFKAGQRCLARKALVKAMGYLEQASALDPMDKKVRETYIMACIKAAHNYSRKGEIDKSRKLLHRVIAASDAHSDDFNRGRAYLYARWAAFERLNGDDAEAETLWSQALSHQQAGEAKLHFFYWIFARHYGVAPYLWKASETLIRNILKGSADVGTAVGLVGTLLYARALPRSHQLFSGELGRIHRYLARAAAQPAVTLSQAKTILLYSLDDPLENSKIVEACTQNILQRFPDNAFFRYHHYIFQLEYGRGFSNLKKEIEALTVILQLAREQKDQMVVSDVQERLEYLKDELSWEEKYEDDFDEDDDDDDDDIPAWMDEMDDRESIDPFAPSRRSRATPKQPKSKSPKKKKPPSGPEQLELF